MAMIAVGSYEVIRKGEFGVTGHKVKHFIRIKASSLDIKVNYGAKQLRFDINVKIIGDSSDGISEVCIYKC